MRLVHALHYLSQYMLKVYYILGKTNIILDVLLRLAIVKQHNISQDNVLNNIWLMSKVFIGNEFKDRFYKGYLANIHF